VTPRAWLVFAVCAAVWGVPYLFIKVRWVAGVLALGEHLGAMSLAGLMLILGGSWLSTATAREVA
jgi:drug/metabolite transporter (DMT)-like permease